MACTKITVCKVIYWLLAGTIFVPWLLTYLQHKSDDEEFDEHELTGCDEDQ